MIARINLGNDEVARGQRCNKADAAYHRQHKGAGTVNNIDNANRCGPTAKVIDNRRAGAQNRRQQYQRNGKGTGGGNECQMPCQMATRCECRERCGQQGQNDLQYGKMLHHDAGSASARSRASWSLSMSTATSSSSIVP